MPRNSATEETRVRARVLSFLEEQTRAPELAQKLSMMRVAKELHISRDTLRKYGLGVLIYRARANAGTRAKARRPVDERLASALKDSELWKARFDNLARDHVVLVNYLKSSTEIDVDAILAKSLPKAMRGAPGGRRGQWRRS